MVLQPRCMLVGTGSAVARRAWGRLGKVGRGLGDKECLWQPGSAPTGSPGTEKEGEVCGHLKRIRIAERLCGAGRATVRKVFGG